MTYLDLKFKSNSNFNFPCTLFGFFKYIYIFNFIVRNVKFWVLKKRKGKKKTEFLVNSYSNCPPYQVQYIVDSQN